FFPWSFPILGRESVYCEYVYIKIGCDFYNFFYIFHTFFMTGYAWEPSFFRPAPVAGHNNCYMFWYIDELMVAFNVYLFIFKKWKFHCIFVLRILLMFH